MNYGPYAVMAGTGVLEDLFDVLAVAKPHGRAGGVDDELPGEVAGELFLIVGQQAA